MNDSFRFYTDSAILNRALEFRVNRIWTETRKVFTCVFWTPISCKNDVTQSNKAVRDIWLPNISLAAEVHAVIYQPMGYIDDQC